MVKSFILEILGRNIKRYRKRKGYTQQELADACGIGFSTVQFAEQGKNLPTVKTLESFCEVLEVDPADLFAKPDQLPHIDSYNDFVEKELHKEITKVLKKAKTRLPKN